MTAPLDAFSGSVIYLDTMLPYMLLRGADPAVKHFFKRMEEGDFAAYTSALTFDELAYRLLLALIKDRYGSSPLDRLRDEEEKNAGRICPGGCSPPAPLAGVATSHHTGRIGCRPGNHERSHGALSPTPAERPASGGYATDPLS